MKLTITTLTGEKYDVEVKEDDTVKDVKAQLYRAGRVTSTMRLLHAQAPMEDDRKLCEYSLPEGAMISALFEPDVDININISTRNEMQRLIVSNARSVKALKVQISGILRCGLAPERLELRLGDSTLENPMPLHFYGINDWSDLDVVKSYVSVMVENNKGARLCWRLNRKDAIGKVKVKLATASKRTDEHSDDNVKVEELHLYLVTGTIFYELDDDDDTVDDCKIKDDDKLYLMSYCWTWKWTATVKKTGRELWGLEKDDTGLGIKVKTQDQMGMPVDDFKLVRLVEEQLEEWARKPGALYEYQYIFNYKELKEISNEEIPFNYKQPLYIVTEQELKEDAARVKEEEKAWRQNVRKAHERNEGEKMKKLGYTGSCRK